jgi:virginiamycin B lyase
VKMIVGMAVCAGLVLGCGSGSPALLATANPAPASAAQATATAVPPSATAHPTPTPLGPPMRDIAAAGAIHIAQGGDWMQVTGGSAWIATDAGVRQLDGKTGAPKAVVPAALICTAMDIGLDRLWFADCSAGTVTAIDPKTVATRTYRLDGATAVEEGSVAAGEGAVWIATADMKLLRLDPTSGRIKAYPLPAPGAGVRAGLGSVWVTAPSVDQVLRIDPLNGSIVGKIPVGRGPRFLAIGGESVWVQNNGDGTVTRLDGAGRVKATTPVSLSPIDGGDVAYGAGFVWPRISAALITKLDGKTGELLATYGPPSGSGSVAADDEAAWVSAHDVTSVWRLPLD